MSRLGTARTTLLGMLVALAWGAAAPAEDDAVYQWTDGEGIVRYTDEPDRIPFSERDTMLRLEPGMPAVIEVESAIPASTPGTIPSMLGGPIPEGATVDPDEPSLTTTAPTPAPARRTGGESPIGQPIPAPDAAAGAPALEPPVVDPAGAEGDERGASALPVWWGPSDGWTPRSTPADGRTVDDGWGPSDGTAPGDWIAAEMGAPDAFERPFQLAQAGPASEARPDAAAGDLDARIRSLESAVARDENRLKDMISDANPAAVPDLQRSPELREIARRLPDLQAELALLRRERASRQAP